MPVPPPISTAYLDMHLVRSERERYQASGGPGHCKGGDWRALRVHTGDRVTEASRGANGRQLPFTLDARQMRRREMGGPLSVARAVTDPRIMRNEPSHRRAHEPSARSDVAPRQAGDTASTVPCPRTAQSNPRGAEARAALSQARGPPGPASPTLRPLGRQPRRRNPT